MLRGPCSGGKEVEGGGGGGGSERQAGHGRSPSLARLPWLPWQVGDVPGAVVQQEDGQVEGAPSRRAFGRACSPSRQRSAWLGAVIGSDLDNDELHASCMGNAGGVTCCLPSLAPLVTLTRLAESISRLQREQHGMVRRAEHWCLHQTRSFLHACPLRCACWPSLTHRIIPHRCRQLLPAAAAAAATAC